MIAPTTYDRVQYTLSHESESIIVTDIRNWKEDEKEFARVKEYDGIFTKFSNDLEFVEDGRDFINFIYETYGVNADIRVIREDRHPITDVWTEFYSAYLDLTTMEDDGTVLTVRAVSGGVEQMLKTREGEKVEIDRMETLDGKALEDLETIQVQMTGRKIFLLSELEDSTPNYFETSGFVPYISPTLNKVVDSDPHIISTYEHFDGSYFVGYNTGDSSKTFPQAQQFFYYENDRAKRIGLTFNIDMNVSFWPDISERQFVKIKIQKSKIGDDPAYPDPVQLYDVIILNGAGYQNSDRLTYSNEGFPFYFDLEKDECLALVWQVPTRLQSNEGNLFGIIRNDITITEDSFFENTVCKMVWAKTLGRRLIEILTNKDVFYSKALTEGDYKHTAFSHGFWLREFDKDEEDDTNRFKPLTTSWRDFSEAMRVTCDLSLGIDIRGRRERIRMEEKKFFYNPIVTIKLPYIVQNLKRSVAGDYYYSGIEAGYEKGGEYEESMGLDEYNGRTNFSTVINKVKNIFTILSPYRTDSYGAEFARRKTKRYYPTTDTRYDNDIFQFDLKINKYNFLGFEIEIPMLRKWADDFETEPENVYSPETAYNLRYSPANLILRHGWNIATAVIKYPNDYLRYGSSNANSNLKTKLIGGAEVVDNEDILNSTLDKARFKPEWVEFEHICDFGVMDQVQGHSNISGEEIPNFYGLVEYRINETDTERGYLFNLRPNGVGDWKILRANL